MSTPRLLPGDAKGVAALEQHCATSTADGRPLADANSNAPRHVGALGDVGVAEGMPPATMWKPDAINQAGREGRNALHRVTRRGVMARTGLTQARQQEAQTERASTNRGP